MNKIQQGFTLIELMIVVAIIGILAAIAIPAYQDYIVRAKVTELVTQADACKTAVAEYYSSQGSLPGDVTTAGCTSQSSKYVASLAVGSGIITVTSTSVADLPSGAQAKTIVLTPTATTTDQPLVWACTTTMTKKYAPANCRG